MASDVSVVLTRYLSDHDQSAIAALRAYPDREALLAALRAIAEGSDTPKDRAKLARKAIYLLTGSPFQGTVEALPKRIADPSQWPVFQSVSLIVDGLGSQGFFVARQRPDGDLAMLSAVYNDQRGIVDGFAEERISKRRFRQFIENAARQVPILEMPPDRLSFLVAHARSTGMRIHPDIQEHLALLDGLPPGVAPAERAAVWVKPNRLSETPRLLESYWFANQWFLTEEGPDAVKLKGFLSDSGPLDARIDRRLSEVFPPSKRESYADRLYRMADWLDLKGEADLRDLAATAAWSLSGKTPLREQPFLRAMMAQVAQWGEASEPEWGSWPVVDAELASVVSWRAAGVALLWVRREAADGRTAGALALLNLMHGGLESVIADNDRDKLRSLHDLFRQEAKRRGSKVASISSGQAGRVFRVAFELGRELAGEYDVDMLWASRIFPQPEGQPEEWERLDPDLLKAIRENQLPPGEAPLASGQELAVFSTLRLRIEDPDALRGALQRDKDLWEDEEPGSWTWTRKYPKGHWNPMAKQKGARQAIGSIRWRGDILELEAKAISMAAALWDRLETAAPGSLSWQGGTWQGAQEFLAAMETKGDKS